MFCMYVCMYVGILYIELSSTRAWDIEWPHNSHTSHTKRSRTMSTPFRGRDKFGNHRLQIFHDCSSSLILLPRHIRCRCRKEGIPGRACSVIGGITDPSADPDLPTPHPHLLGHFPPPQEPVATGSNQRRDPASIGFLTDNFNNLLSSVEQSFPTARPYPRQFFHTIPIRDSCPLERDLALAGKRENALTAL